jgi:branched-chain amino acid transport system substrate-binding protein
MATISTCSQRLALWAAVVGCLAVNGGAGDCVEGPLPTPTPVPSESYRDLSFEELLHVPTTHKSRGIFFGPAGEPSADTVRIGLLTPCSRFEKYSQELIDSVDLATHEINAEGGVLGKKLVIIRADDGGDRDLAEAAAKKLINSWNTVAFIGPTGSDRALAVAKEVAIPSKIVLITPDATSPAIADLDDHGLVWRTPASDTLHAKIAADFAITKLRAETAGIIYLRTLYGIGLKEEFSRVYSSLGGKVVGSVSVSELVDYSSYDLDPALGELFTQRPDFIYFAMTEIEAAPITRQIEDGAYFTADYRPFCLGSDAVRGQALLDNCSRVVAEGLFVTSSSTQTAEEFTARFRTSFGLAPKYAMAAHAYDNVYLIAYAIAASNSIEPTAFAPYLKAVTEGEVTVGVGDYREAILSLKAHRSIRYVGASGAIRFDERGDNTAAHVEISKLQGGSFVPVQQY